MLVSEKRTLKLRDTTIWSGLCLLHDAACSDVAAAVIGLFRIVHSDAGGSAGVYEFETLGVGIDFGDDAHMSDVSASSRSSEKDEVAFAKLFDVGHGFSLVELASRRPGELNVLLFEHVAREAAAIKAVGIALPAAVAYADVSERGGEQFVYESIVLLKVK